MAVRIEVNPIFQPELTEKIIIPQRTFYYMHAPEKGEITAVRSLGDTEGAAIYYRDGFFRDPKHLDYFEARELFNREAQVAHILPWLSKAITIETLAVGSSEVVFSHFPDQIVFTPVRLVT